MDSSSDYEDEDSEYQNSSIEKQDLPSLVFEIQIDNKTWETIKPTSKLCRDNRWYDRLGEDWVDAVTGRVWRASKLPCCIIFKKHTFYKRKDKFFDFYGRCKDCDA